MLPRLERVMRPVLGTAQAGGVLGADVAALRLLILLVLRRLGRAPGLQAGGAPTCVAFVDLLRSFFDRVWRCGELWPL